MEDVLLDRSPGSCSRGAAQLSPALAGQTSPTVSVCWSPASSICGTSGRLASSPGRQTFFGMVQCGGATGWQSCGSCSTPRAVNDTDEL